MARSRLKTLIDYIRPYWRQELGGIGTLLIVNALGVYIPLLIRNSIDELQAMFDFQLMLKYVIIILVMTTVMWVIRVASRMRLYGVDRQVEFDLKQKIFEHLLTLEPAYFAANPVGDLINRATSDVDSIRRLVGFAMLSFANIVFAYGLTIPVMLSINVKLTVLALSVYPLLMIIVQLFSDQLRTQQQTVQEELSNLSDLIQEDMSGISLIKIYAQEENERRAFADKNETLLKANLKLAKTRSLLFPILGGLASISLLVLLAFGGNAIADKVITVGDFVALLLYVERLVFPTALMGFTITTYQRGEVSVDRVEAILEAKPKPVEAPITKTLFGPFILPLDFTYAIWFFTL